MTPAPLTITAQDASKVYGQTAVLNGFDASALVNDETVGFVSMSSEGQSELSSEVGSPYAIVPSNARGGSFTPSNYSISYVSGVLTVTPITAPTDVPVVQPVPPSNVEVPSAEAPSVIPERQALPNLPQSDARPAPLSILPMADSPQGPVTAAIVLAPAPTSAPANASVPALVLRPLATPKAAVVDEPPVLPAPMPIRRPLKQDRN